MREPVIDCIDGGGRARLLTPIEDEAPCLPVELGGYGCAACTDGWPLDAPAAAAAASGLPPLGSAPAAVSAERAGDGPPLDDPEVTLATLADAPDIEAPRTTLADVGGMEDVKRRLELAFLGPARNPALRRAFGK